MLAARITLPQISTSTLICLAMSSGVLATGSKPSAARRSLISASAMLRTISRLSEVAMSVGVPAGTPTDIATSLNREIVRSMALAEIKERLAALGFEPVASTPEDMAKQIKVEVEIWGKVIRAANIKAG